MFDKLRRLTRQLPVFDGQIEALELSMVALLEEIGKSNVKIHTNLDPGVFEQTSKTTLQQDSHPAEVKEVKPLTASEEITAKN